MKPTIIIGCTNIGWFVTVDCDHDGPARLCGGWTTAQLGAAVYRACLAHPSAVIRLNGEPWSGPDDVELDARIVAQWVAGIYRAMQEDAIEQTCGPADRAMA
jgi:hypothetical protein